MLDNVFISGFMGGAVTMMAFAPEHRLKAFMIVSLIGLAFGLVAGIGRARHRS